MMGFLLGLMPARFLAAGAAVLALLLALGVQTRLKHNAQAETVEVKAAWAQERAQNTAAALEATTKNRAIEQAVNATQKEDLDEAERLSTRARAAAAGAASADAGLRIAARAAAASCSAVPGDPTARAEGPADRLADVLAASTAEYRAVAEAADAAIIAGGHCSADYDALTAAASAITLPRAKFGE